MNTPRVVYIVKHTMESGDDYAVGPFVGLEELQHWHEGHDCVCTKETLPLYVVNSAVIVVIDPAKDRAVP
jgi:hypothetical protein